MPVLIILASPPGGGKGTIAERLKKDGDLVHLSTGDLLRKEVAEGSEIGEHIDKLMKSGQLVSEGLVNSMVTKSLQSAEVRRRGAILDGYPRTESQALLLEQFCRNSAWRVDAFVVIDVPDAVLLERAGGRRLDPVTGLVYNIKYKPAPQEVLSRLIIRPDDRPDRQLKRISIYRDFNAPIERVFRQQMLRINGNQSINDVYQEFCKLAVPRMWGPKSSRPTEPVPEAYRKYVDGSQGKSKL